MKDQDIDDILEIAFEGGINYWCSNVKVVDDDYKGATFASEAVSKGATLILTVNEYDTSVPIPLPLTRERIVKGIKVAAKLSVQTISGFIENADAFSADVAVQYAVFDTLIFV